MITSVWLKDYRSFAEETVTLAPLTVLVGRNGAGKSNVLKAMTLVKDAMTFGLDVAMSRQGGWEAFRRWQAGDQALGVGLGLRIKTPSLEAEYRIVLSSTSAGPVKEEQCTVQQDGIIDEFETRVVKGQKKWIKRPRSVSTPSESRYLSLPLLGGTPGFKDVYRTLSEMSFYTIIPDLLQDPQLPQEDYPLEEKGENLVSVLRKFDDAQRHSVNEALYRITGDVQRYTVEKSGTRMVVHLHHQTADNGPDFELSQESDGTIRVLALLTALYQRPYRSLIALEEPELTIHPGAMGVLWEEIKKASKRSQILVTTHSPDLLDMCAVDQIRVVEKDAGITRVGPVNEQQRAMVHERLFAPGEILRARGLERAEEA